ncbi:MAG: thioredoxin domain-containing protein [Campylobacterota bacterium]|nr:thioredoxin domain-containing protein [Campylobacterota bacterium]
MSKLSAILLLSISLFGSAESDLIGFLKKNFERNPNLVSTDIKVIEKVPMQELKGWTAYIVLIKANIKAGESTKSIRQRMVYFSNGTIMAQDLTNIKTGQPLSSTLAPKFKPEFYTKENRIYGNADAEHKVAIFSDPLCPFCRRFVPEAINEMRAHPDKVAIYYYHLPLASMHPAAVALTKAAIAAEHQGRRDVVLNMYKVEVNARETDETKILAAFNKTLNTNIKVTDIHTPEVEAQFKHDQNVVMNLMVNGTPTLYFDGVKDASKKKYKAVLGK